MDRRIGLGRYVLLVLHVINGLFPGIAASAGRLENVCTVLSCQRLVVTDSFSSAERIQLDSILTNSPLGDVAVFERMELEYHMRFGRQGIRYLIETLTDTSTQRCVNAFVLLDRINDPAILEGVIGIAPKIKNLNKERITPVKFEWANEYYAASVSESALDVVRAYIDNQDEHHRRRTHSSAITANPTIYGGGHHP